MPWHSINGSCSWQKLGFLVPSWSCIDIFIIIIVTFHHEYLLLGVTFTWLWLPWRQGYCVCLSLYLPCRGGNRKWRDLFCYQFWSQSFKFELVTTILKLGGFTFKTQNRIPGFWIFSKNQKIVAIPNSRFSIARISFSDSCSSCLLDEACCLVCPPYMPVLLTQN